MRYPLWYDVEGNVMHNGKYFSRSWALLTRDKGWIKPLLVMAAANLVPIAGALGNRGYALEWARLSAWGADAAPKQKNVDVGKCILSGARAMVVAIGWGIAITLLIVPITVLANVMPRGVDSVASALASFVGFVFTAFAGMFVEVAEIRTAIYEGIGAGYRVDRIFELVKRDFEGFCKLFAIKLACSFVLGIVAGMFAVILVFAFLPLLIGLAAGHTNYETLTLLAGNLMWVVPFCAVFGYLFSFLENATRMVVTNAVGLWMRQFDVPRWGRSEDPLPTAPSDSPRALPQLPPVQAYRQEPSAWQGEPVRQEPVAPEPEPEVVETIPLVRVMNDEGQGEAPAHDETPVRVDELFLEDDEPSVDDLYDGLRDAIRENDRVEGDEEEEE